MESKLGARARVRVSDDRAGGGESDKGKKGRRELNHGDRKWRKGSRSSDCGVEVKLVMRDS